MEYISREIERKILKLNKVFKAILLTGARQVGKTTTLKKLAEESKRVYVSMDNLQDRELAQRDPKLFFQIYKPPILIDEVQKAPELFEAIKEICDASEERGLFWLTGSESVRLLKNAGDSLAGRICILRMYSFSQREKTMRAQVGEFPFSFQALRERRTIFGENNINDVFEHIWRGGMPQVQNMDEEELREYFSSYVDTYLLRDAVDNNGINDTSGFKKVLIACAAFVGCLVNYSDLATAGGVSVPTAKSWIKILENMGIIYLLEPYSHNRLKHLVKTPKLYFCDTGLAAFLSQLSNKEVLQNGAAAGKFFENYVVGEFLRTFSYGPSKANLSYYRDSNQKEIKLIIEADGIIHPVQIKKATSVNERSIKAFAILKNANLEVGEGLVACMTDRVYPIDGGNFMVPCNVI